MKVKIIIERAKDGTFGAYAENIDGVFGMGDTVIECKNSILQNLEINQEIGNLPANKKYELVYKFDAESLLNYYKGILSNPAIERLTGINQKQIHHYATGLKKPRPAQKKKIQEGLHKLGEELLAIEL